MPERPHSRKVKIEKGTAEVQKGERIGTGPRASERGRDETHSQKKENGERESS